MGLQVLGSCADADTYNPVKIVKLQVQVDGALFDNGFAIKTDQSVVAEDTPGNQYGVDLWLNDGNGTALKTGSLTKQALPPLVTIFGPGMLTRAKSILTLLQLRL